MVKEGKPENLVVSIVRIFFDVHLLKISHDTLKKYGAVSEQICLAMVQNLNKISNTDISFSITGIAGPSGGTKNKPVGLVYFGIKKGNIKNEKINNNSF